MTISVSCESCQREIRAKDEYAGKRVRCPACQNPVVIPAAEIDPVADLGFDWNAELPASPPSAAGPATLKAAGTGKGIARAAEKPWYRTHWQWGVVAGVLLLAIIPTVGVIVALLAFVIGMVMALVGGLIPIFQILIGAPGTVLLLIFSRSARFEMMRQPEDHPYKVLVRTAGLRTRGLLWRGVLLMLVLIPALYLQGLGSEFFRHRQRAAAGDAEVPPAWPGPLAQQEPRNQQQPQPAGIAPGHPPAGGAPLRPELGGAPGAGLGPPGHRGHAPAGLADRLLYITLSYGAFDGANTPAEVVTSVVGSSPGFIAGSVESDEAAQVVRFQHRGPVNPATFMRSLAESGLRSIRWQESTQAPE